MNGETLNQNNVRVARCPVPKLKDAVLNIQLQRKRKIAYLRILQDLLINMALKG
jgi:hypothetical protein